MERLTFEGNFCDIAQCVALPTCDKDNYCSQRKVWERLKAYEDAEGQGRLVVLPCKVGDKVYITTFERKIEKLTVSEIRLLGYAVYIQCYGVSYPIKLLGKTVFLTRAEAEAALERRGGDG